MTALIQCVPNFSEGRDRGVIAAIVGAIQAAPGVRLVDWSADADHNRLVVTFVGPPSPVRDAALAAAAVAIEHIDLRTHQGVHPRLGAVDVLPFVPISGITLGECAEIACAAGAELAALYGLPVFLYEAASVNRHSLPFVRKSAFRDTLPDFGPILPHVSAGASVVGARGPLVAYNINLAAREISAARTIARELRVHPDLPGIRALGLRLPSRSITQVSMNITCPAETSLFGIFDTVKRRAEELGTSIIESEVIGALPGDTAFRILADALQATGLAPGQILLENWPDQTVTSDPKTSDPKISGS